MSHYSRGDEDDEFNDDVEEEDDDGKGGVVRSSNDHNILLIDARPNMFEPINDAGDVSVLLVACF